MSDILEMDSEHFLLLAAFAESKLEKPAVVDYLLFNHLYREEYMEQHEINDDDFEYTYEMHLKELSGETEEDKNVETFVTENGRVVRGNREEYLKHKAYEKELLRRRSAGLPPIAAAKFFASLDHEGIDIEQLANARADDTTSVAAFAAKSDLKKKLDQDENLRLAGVKKNKTFSWQNDKDI